MALTSRSNRRVGNSLPRRLPVDTAHEFRLVLTRGQQSCPRYGDCARYVDTGVDTADTHDHANALVSPAP
jgi:hypothetical protein